MIQIRAGCETEDIREGARQHGNNTTLFFFFALLTLITWLLLEIEKALSIAAIEHQQH